MSQQEHNLQMDYIEFPATDIAATKAFYNQVFGWQFQDWGPGYTSFNDGRLGGGFNSETKPAGAGSGTLVVIYATHWTTYAGKSSRRAGESFRRPSSFPEASASISPTRTGTSSPFGVNRPRNCLFHGSGRGCRCATGVSCSQT